MMRLMRMIRMMRMMRMMRMIRMMRMMKMIRMIRIMRMIRMIRMMRMRMIYYQGFLFKSLPSQICRRRALNWSALVRWLGLSLGGGCSENP
jgi:hypothetical protein